MIFATSISIYVCIFSSNQIEPNSIILCRWDWILTKDKHFSQSPKMWFKPNFLTKSSSGDFCSRSTLRSRRPHPPSSLSSSSWTFFSQSQSGLLVKTRNTLYDFISDLFNVRDSIRFQIKRSVCQNLTKISSLPHPQPLCRTRFLFCAPFMTIWSINLTNTWEAIKLNYNCVSNLKTWECDSSKTLICFAVHWTRLKIN